MRKINLLLVFSLFALVSLQAQTMEELKSMKAEKEAMIADCQDKIAAWETEIADISKEINYLSGWRKGVTGILGLNFSNANKWIAFPNPSAESSSFTANLTGFASYEQPKYFWDNKLLVNQGWQRLRTCDGCDVPTLFDNDSKTLDLLNLSSLAGYKLSEKLALSGLAELNTSIVNFFEPGTFDLGLGATYSPTQNFRIVFHPLNMHAAWMSQAIKDNAVGDLDNPNITFGAKLRADYTQEFTLAGKTLAWSSTFSGFLPYSDKPVVYMVDGATKEVGAREWTWINSVSFEVWRGIGVGIGFGLRDAEFEIDDLQSYYNLGLSYAF